MVVCRQHQVKANTSKSGCARVSVIVPVYQAAPYVAQAVMSALEQPGTGEILLIEEGSTDRSPEIGSKLASSSPKTRLFRHHDGRNRGAEASRNRGIVEARHDLIAVLDVDDYYLPGRFSQCLQLIEHDSVLDGVYGLPEPSTIVIRRGHCFPVYLLWAGQRA